MNTLLLPENREFHCKDAETFGSFVNYLIGRYGAVKISKGDKYAYVIELL
ncbi:MAG: hypothetical protein ACFB2Y_16880 [Fulvivirga sp.]